MADVETYYSLLQLAENASAAEIKAAHRRLIREVHPDLLPSNAPAYWQRQAKEKTQEINDAYANLSDKETRSSYDAQLAVYRRTRSASSGQATSRTSTSSGANPSSQRSQASSQSQHGSSAGASSAGAAGSSSKQQQATSASTTPMSTHPQSSKQAVASRLNPGVRFVSAWLAIGPAFSAAGAFCSAVTVEEGLFPLLAAVVLFLGVACLYQRHISRFLVAIRVRRDQHWVVTGVIVFCLFIGRMEHNGHGSPANPVRSLQPSAAVSQSMQQALPAKHVSMEESSFGVLYPWYVNLINTRTTQNWYLQEVDPDTPVGTKVYITFSIHRDGSVSDVQVQQSSGSSTLDSSCVRAVERVGSYGPLPSGYTGATLLVQYYCQQPATPETAPTMRDISGG